MTSASDDRRSPADAATEGWAQIRRHLQEEMSRGRGPWMALPVEELPRLVAPLTHSLYSRYLTAPEGMPAVMRTLGFDPALDGGLDGLLLHIAGRSMLDLSRVPNLFSSFGEVEYDQDLLRSRPRMVFHHPLTPLGGDDGRLLSLTRRRLELIASDFHARLEQNSLPLFKDWVGARSEMGFDRLSEHVLTDQWREMVEQIWFWMIGDLVLARSMSGFFSAEILALVWDKSEPDELDHLMRRLLVCSAVTPGLRMRDALHRLGNGKIDLDVWVSEFGYRGPAEWDLAEKRWREMPEALAEKARVVSLEAQPMEQHQLAVAGALGLEESLAGRMGRRDRARFLDILLMWRRYEAVIQEVEDSVLQGLDMMRAIALEMGRRTELESDIFYLTEQELIGAVESAMPVWKDCDERKHRLMDQRDYPVPAFIGDDELAQWEEILVRAESEPRSEEAAIDLTGEEDMRLAAGYVPPSLAPDERRSFRFGWVIGLLWFLVLLPLVPGFPGQGGDVVWSVLGRILWPITAFAGCPGAAVLLGVCLALVLALFQRFLPAFHRWGVMYHRTRLLEKSGADWPENTPRGRLIHAVSEHARKRLARGRASGLLLVWGALALVCGWLAMCLNAGLTSAADSVAVISATVPEGVSGALRLEPGEGVELAVGEQADHIAHPFRKVLENQLQSWKSSSNDAGDGRPRPPDPMLHALADFLQSPRSDAQVFEWRLVQASARPGQKKAELLLDGDRLAEIRLFSDDPADDAAGRWDSASLFSDKDVLDIDPAMKEKVTLISVRYVDAKPGAAGSNGGGGIFGLWMNTGWVGAFLLGFLGVYLPMRAAFRFP